MVIENVMLFSSCLLQPKTEGVLRLLKNQLVLIEVFCSDLEAVSSHVNWRKGEEIPSKEFKRLVQKFKAVEEIGKVFTVGKIIILVIIFLRQGQ